MFCVSVKCVVLMVEKKKAERFSLVAAAAALTKTIN